MTPESDPLAELLRRYDQPAAPAPAFAATLRAQLRAELAAPGPSPEEKTQMTPIAVPLPVAPRNVRARSGSSWRALLQLVAAAGLLVTLAGGALLGRALWPGMTAFFQAPEGSAPASVPMRGVDPGRTSVNPGPAPAGTPGLAWSAFAGVGAHPPIVVDDAVYVATDFNDVIAYDRATGAERWRVPLSGGTDTPTYAAGLLYVSYVTDSETGNSAGTLVALDAASGDVRWRVATGSLGGASPVVVGDTVYAGGDQEVYAFDAATGALRWMTTLDAVPCSCSPRPLAVADGLVFAVPGGTRQASLFALDTASGERQWRFDGGTGHYFTDPVVANGRVYLGQSLIAADMAADMAAEPNAGAFFALDETSGDIVWTWPVADSAMNPLGNTLAGPPAVTSDAVYFHVFESQNTADLTSTLRALDPRTGDALWTVPAVDASFAAPAIAGDLIIVPGGEREGYAAGFDDVMLLAYDTKTGAEQWRLDLAGSISGQPAVLNGSIFVTTYDEGVLYALGDAGTPLAGASPQAAVASPQAPAAGTPET